MRTKIVLSAIFFLVSLFSFIFICLESPKFLFLIPFAVPPVAIIYLSVFNKLSFKIQKLRILGFAYWLIVVIIIMALL